MTPQAPHNIPLVVVEWDDAHVDQETPVTLENVRDTHKPMRVTTIGWLLFQDEKGVTLVNEFYEHTFRGKTFIYAPMIVAIKPFKLATPKTKKPRKAALKDGEVLLAPSVS